MASTATFGLINSVLPGCLAHVVDQYLRPETWHSRAVARSGYREFDSAITNYAEGLYGALEGGNSELACEIIYCRPSAPNEALICAGYEDDVFMMNKLISLVGADIRYTLINTARSGLEEPARSLILWAYAHRIDFDIHELSAIACRGYHHGYVHTLFKCGLSICSWCGLPSNAHPH